MRRAVPVLAVVLLLAGCGTSSSGGSSLPTLATTTAPTVTTPAATPTTTAPVVDPSPWTALPKRDVGPNKGVYTGVVLASSVAGTPDETSAAQAWVAFWGYITKAGYEVKVDQAQLDAVASGGPADTIKQYVASLKANHRRTIGWVSLNVTDVSVTNGIALLKGCADNGSYDVDATTGKRLERGSVAFDIEAAVRKVNGRLVVTSSSAKVLKQPCAK